MKLFDNNKLQEFNNKKVESDYLYIRIEELVKQLSQILNAIHSVNYSVNFWSILLFDYVEDYFEKRKLGYIWEKENNLKRKNKLSIIGYIKSLLSLLYWQKLQLILPFSNKFYINEPKNNKRMDRFKRFRDIKPLGNPRGNLQVLNEIQIIVQKQQDNEVKELLINLPTSVTIYFKWYISKVRIYHPKKKEFHVLNYSEPFVAFFLAIYREYGALIHKYQHGSHYGEQYNYGYSEFKNSDYFHTWGWKNKISDVPDESKKLLDFEMVYKRHFKPNFLYDLLILTGPPDEKIVKRDQQKLEYILTRLDRTKFKKILIRPRPISRFMLNQSYDETITKFNLHRDSANRHIAHSVAISQYVFHLQGPSTTMLECLYVNHPIISFYNFNSNPTKIALEYYQKFYEDGLYHLNEYTLLNHLNRFVGNGWWNSVLNKEHYKNYKDNFCKKIE